MAFCPRCGATTTPGMSFCTACGEDLPAVAPPPVPGAAGVAGSGAAGVALAGAEGAPRGPVGKRVRPLVAALLAFFLSGVYPLWFWWRTSREMDAYAGSSSHPLVRVGVGIAAAAILLSVVIGAMVAQELGLTTLAQEEGVQVAAERFVAAVAAHPWTAAQVGLSLLGAGILYVGLWRLWSAIRAEDQRRGRSTPFDPRLALVVVAGGTLLPLLSYALTDQAMLGLLDIVVLVFTVGTLLVIYQTQARLNETWAAATGRP